MALAKAGFTLGVRPVYSLLPHEETIPEHVRLLAAEILRDGVQKDPIIIDESSGTVLDGMHRIAALKDLQVKNVVCCGVDYRSTAVTLGRWARVYKTSPGAGASALASLTEGMRRVRIADAIDALGRGEAGFAVIASDRAYLSERGTDFGEVRISVAGIDRVTEAEGWQRSFVPEEDMDEPLTEGGSFAVLARRPTKEDVVSAARSGRLFPCKTSMHTIDPRPVAVNFPLGGLEASTAGSLRQTLGGKEGRLVPGNSLYGGRRYKERLLMLDQP